MRAQGLKPQGLPVLDGKLRYVAVEGNKGREKSGAYRGFYDEGRPAGAGATHEMSCRCCIGLIGYPARSLSM